MGAILGEDGDVGDGGVDTVTEGKINDAVLAREGDGRLGALLRKQTQALALASGQNDCQHFTHGTVYPFCVRFVPTTHHCGYISLYLISCLAVHCCSFLGSLTQKGGRAAGPMLALDRFQSLSGRSSVP